jgi:uncharacterized protein
MTELWISLQDIPAEGRDFTFTDQSLWTEPMQEFRVLGKVGRPFEASMRITPQDGGFLVSGSYSGSVIQPCGRCAEEFELPLSGNFDSFEEPGVTADDIEDASRVRVVKGVPEFDAAGYLWEQFLLALPEKPLCFEDCKGLCPQCGINRNQGSCTCARDNGDPRLAVLRNLKLQ